MSAKTVREVIERFVVVPHEMLVAALDAAGFVIVPKEPTDEMLLIGRQAAMASDEDWSVNATYCAMVGAASMDSPNA